ncbi:MAG: hypothetical protein ABMA64_38100 [Myxococcota bacterium]
MNKWIAWVLVAGCGQEIVYRGQNKVPPAPPPGEVEDDQGEPPDWQNCYQGWRGKYTNLSVHDEFVAPRPTDEPAPTDPESFDYWEKPLAYEKFDPTLDFGQNWWPIDEELEGDPMYFAVHWDAWVRAWSNTEMVFTLGSQDDAWVYVNGEPIASKPGIQEYVRDEYRVGLEGGQYPIDVWFTHRGSAQSGFSFRVLSGDLSICYPDF